MSAQTNVDVAAVLARLAEAERRKDDDVAAKQRCSQLLEAIGDGRKLVEFYEQEVSLKPLLPRRQFVEAELAGSLALYVLSRHWRDNIDPATMEQRAESYRFNEGCRVQRYHNGNRAEKMVLIAIGDPLRSLTFVRKYDSWVLECRRGWRPRQAARAHHMSRSGGVPQVVH